MVLSQRVCSDEAAALCRHHELLILQPEDANTEHGGHGVEMTRQRQQRLSSIFGPVIPQRGLDLQCGVEICIFF